MAYTIKGTYVASCDCVGVCPCPVDGTPATENGECKGAAAFAVTEGNLDGTNLGGVNFVLYNYFPANISAGNWKVGLVIDDGASDEQAQAIERIVSGEEGGPFGEFKPLIGDYAGMERASVAVATARSRCRARASSRSSPSQGRTDRRRPCAGRCSASPRNTRSARLRASRTHSGSRSIRATASRPSSSTRPRRRASYTRGPSRSRRPVSRGPAACGPSHLSWGRSYPVSRVR